MTELLKDDRSEQELWAAGFTDTLRDWQHVAGESDADPSPWLVQINNCGGGKIEIDVIAPDKTARSIWIEVQDGNLVARCYDAAHETFMIHFTRPALEPWQVQCERELGGNFCKTERKPYDAAVTACLCYLATITRKDDPETGEPIIGTEAFGVSSDGSGKDFLAGLELARATLPRKANQIDLPMGVMQDDRWCAPWVSCKSAAYDVQFCVDGFGYVMRSTGESYRFDSHADLARWLDANKEAHFKRGGSTGWGEYGRTEPNIWNATGCFDEARHRRIARAQATKLAGLFPVDAAHAHQPPAFVRPGDFPDNAGRPFCYYAGDVLMLDSAA